MGAGDGTVAETDFAEDNWQAQALLGVADVVAAVERRRGEKRDAFASRHGDWGRELVLYLARQRSGLTLRAIGAALGMKEYKTVAKAIQRFASALSRDATKRRFVRDCLNEISNVEM